VIRVEQPLAGTEEMFGRRDGPDFQNLHRNKRAVQLNLKSAEGLEAFHRLVKKADILVENMRADVKHKLKVDYDALRAINPRLIYGSISGFGQSGPYAKRAGVDQIVQGMGGLMSITGAPGGGPMRVGIAVTDLSAGNILACGLMMALYQREKTGQGRWVHTSLLESQVMMLDFQAARWLMDGEIAGQSGNDHPTGIPNGVYATADDPINISAFGPRLWTKFCEAVGKTEWLTKQGWQTIQERSVHRQAINAAIEEITRTKPSAYWVDLLDAAGIPCGPINNIKQVFDDRQVQHLGLAQKVTLADGRESALVASPLNFEGSAKRPLEPAPERDADTHEVLAELGYSQEDIAAMKRKGAI
jgi:formyl-CoA transferase